MTIAGTNLLMSVRESGDRVAMAVDEGVTIPLRSVRFVQCRVAAEVGEAHISPLDAEDGQQLASVGAIVARGLGRVSCKGGHAVAFAHVANPGRSAVRLEKGWTIAWLEPALSTPILAVLTTIGEKELRPEDTELKPEMMGGLTEDELEDLLRKADGDLSAEEREKFRQFLKEHEGVFKTALAPPGAALTIPHEIDTQGHAPIKR